MMDLLLLLLLSPQELAPVFLQKSSKLLPRNRAVCAPAGHAREHVVEIDGLCVLGLAAMRIAAVSRLARCSPATGCRSRCGRDGWRWRWRRSLAGQQGSGRCGRRGRVFPGHSNVH